MASDAHHGHPSTTPCGPSGPGGATRPIGPVGRDPLPLAGRTVLVTGVSRRIGIGHAIACRAADYGASIVAHHYRPHDASQPWGADNIDAVMDSIRTHLVGPARLVDILADLAAPGEPARVVEQAAAAAGHLDALVCNQAMSSPDGSLSEMTEAVLDAHWAVDARASILLAQAFAAQEGFASPAPAGSARRRGSIVFLTSGQGLGPLPGEIAYAAAKAAIAGLTLTISDESSSTPASPSTRSTPAPSTPATSPRRTARRPPSCSPRGAGASLTTPPASSPGCSPTRPAGSPGRSSTPRAVSPAGAVDCRAQAPACLCALPAPSHCARPATPTHFDRIFRIDAAPGRF